MKRLKIPKSTCLIFSFFCFSFAMCPVSWAQVSVILDLDQTILEKVMIGTHLAKLSLEFPEREPLVQKIDYTPCDFQLDRYRRENADKKKDLNFVFKDTEKTEIEAHFLVRYGFERLLVWIYDVLPGLAKDKVKIYVASSNDDERTKAFLRKLLIGKKTLGQWTENQMISRKEFVVSEPYGKNMLGLRKALGVSEEERVIVIDDRADIYHHRSPSDLVVQILPWASEDVERFLLSQDQDHSEVIHQQEKEIERVIDLIKAQFI